MPPGKSFSQVPIITRRQREISHSPQTAFFGKSFPQEKVGDGEGRKYGFHAALRLALINPMSNSRLNLWLNLVLKLPLQKKNLPQITFVNLAKIEKKN